MSEENDEKKPDDGPLSLDSAHPPISEPAPLPPADDAPKAAPPPVEAPPKVEPKKPRPWLEIGWENLRDYFLAEDPSFWVAMVPALALAGILYTRRPDTNCIFDEQEALLANPYVHGKGLGWLDAFHRDFWGLPPDRSVGSYRPIPDLIWRAVFHVSQQPWLHHWMNVLCHAANGACLVTLVFWLTQRRGLAWMIGAVFVACAVLTEAVSGVVGLADCLGGLGAILGLMALRLPLWGMPFAVFAAMLLGLFSKESMLVCVPLLPVAALLWAPLTHPDKPARWARGAVCAIAAVLGFVVYVEIRKRAFPAPMEATLNDPLPDGAGLGARAYRAFMVWFHQPPLPKDPLNNPLIKADMPHRVAGALRVYARGLGQILAPITLSGDYSSPQEPIPETLVFPESVIGALGLIVPPVVGLVMWIRELRAEKRIDEGAEDDVIRAETVSLDAENEDAIAPADRAARFARTRGPYLLVALGLIWLVVSYFPHSNIPVLLPTVRAERFWYFPAIGTALVLGTFFVFLYERTKHIQDGALAVGLFALFFTFQCGKAYQHSTHYRDDLVFWTATRDAVPNSAKAHLNYSVMWGARGRMDIRLEGNRRALELAPEWPMAHIYLGDTLCRMGKPEEAWPHYARGFVMADNDPNLLSLGIQCLWDQMEPPTEEGAEPERAFRKHEAELLKMADDYPGSWLAYLARDTATNGDEHNGVDPKYRPRGYNEGPKD